MTMTSTAWRVSVVGVCAMAMLSCSSSTAPDAETRPSPATATVGRVTNEDVTDRARAALAGVGVQQLVAEPGYENESNAALEGVWRAHRVIAYVVPTSALPSSSELTVVGRRTIDGQSVDVVTGEDSTVQLVRFVLGPDTWLVASPDRPTMGDALAGALLA